LKYILFWSTSILILSIWIVSYGYSCLAQSFPKMCRNTGYQRLFSII
jgi:hypothetical protein